MRNKLHREAVGTGMESIQRAAWAGCSRRSGYTLICIVGKSNAKLAYSQNVKAHILLRSLMAGVRVLSFTCPLKAFPSGGSSTCHVPHSQIW